MASCADAALASDPGGSSGNYGLMDQQVALRWVQHGRLALWRGLLAQVGQDCQDPAVIFGCGQQAELGEQVPDVGLHGLG
jgi:Carboxylesterase family